jgi:ABC-type transport system involved in multi-copper enzyme maturation permease subunit
MPWGLPMGIREKGYHPWDGELKRSGIPWLPIFFKGLKQAFRRKYSKVVFGFAGLPFLVFLAAVYVSTKPELRMLRRLVDLLNNDAAFFNFFYSSGWLTFVLLVLCLFVGAGLISGDLKSNSFPLYFSRPLDRKDYIFGKFSILLFYLLLFSLLPGILLVLFKIMFTGGFGFGLSLIVAIVVYPIVIALFFSSFTLMISSLSPNNKFVSASIFLIYVFSNGLAEILRSIFKSPHFQLFSLEINIRQVGAYFFNVGKVVPIAPLVSLVILLGLTMAMTVILYLRIVRAEAQVESSG